MKQPNPPAGTTGIGRWQVALAAAGIVAAALVAYANSFAGVFVYDDEPTILLNPSVRDLWSSLFPTAGTTASGRPVANLTFAFNYALGGTSVGGYHAVNLAIHTLAGLTLFGLVRRTIAQGWRTERVAAQPTPKKPAATVQAVPNAADRPIPSGWTGAATAFAFGAALLWTLHPLQTESVTYVVQRVESLMGLFYLATFYCFVRSLESTHALRWRSLAVTACLLGMGTKEVAATGPALLILFDRTFVAGTFRRAWTERRGFYLALAATWLPMAALVATTGGNRDGTVGFDVGLAPWTYWLTQPEAVVRYLALAVWPHPLVFDYDPASARELAAVLPYAAIVLPLAGATLWALRHRPVAGFLGAWFLAILAPTSIVPNSMQVIAEHRMYLPLAALLVAGAGGLHRLLGRHSMAAILVLAAGLGWATAQRNTVYRSERSIWADTVAKVPANDRAHNNLGNVLAKEGEVAVAVEHYRAALRIRPNCSDTHYNLGNALRRLGNPAAAIPHYEESLRLAPRQPDARAALANACEEAGRSDEALAHYRQALQLAPGDVAVRNRLGRLLATVGRLPEAIEQYEQVVTIAPGSAQAHVDLGLVLAMSDRTTEAIPRFEQALRLDPRHPQAHLYLAIALDNSGRSAEAAAHLEEARRLGARMPRPAD